MRNHSLARIIRGFYRRYEIWTNNMFAIPMVWLRLLARNLTGARIPEAMIIA